jgi:hypothetical protein
MTAAGAQTRLPVRRGASTAELARRGTRSRRDAGRNAHDSTVNAARPVSTTTSPAPYAETRCDTIAPV